MQVQNHILGLTLIKLTMKNNSCYKMMQSIIAKR